MALYFEQIFQNVHQLFIFFLYQLTAKIIVMGFCGYVVMMSKNPSIKIW